jgi:SAM-dependent methyltransferase
VKALSVTPVIRDLYNNQYSGESEWRKIGAQEKVRNIQTLCAEIPHDRILDIGSGEGSILQGLSDRNFGLSFCSLEISESAVRTIRERKIAKLKECSLFDGYTIPYADGAFDLAILSHVVEHVEYPRRLLQEASRTARFIFVEVPLEDTVRLKANYIPLPLGHINFYSPKTIRLLIQTCGLDVLTQITTNPSRQEQEFQFGFRGTLKYLFKDSLLSLSPVLATRFLTYHSSLLCTRKA